MGGHFSGALIYADNIKVLSPSMSGLRTRSKVYEEYEFNVLFYGKNIRCVF